MTETLNSWSRRDFLVTSTAAALGLLHTRIPASGGPYSRDNFDRLIPADKHLSPEWIKSLFERGTPEVLRGGELKYVGMPIGGMFAGQLYLGGDGRLWHWDIFNQNLRTREYHYAEPPIPSSPLKQGFSLEIDGQTRSLSSEGFADVTFRGEYPIGIVEYSDANVPATVRLEAFSPFIPLNVDDSGLPATILQFTIRNTSTAPIEATLIGELENGVCLFNRSRYGLLRSRVLREPSLTAILFSAEDSAPSQESRPDIVFEDWDKDDFTGWNVEGTAFGTGPVLKSELPDHMGDIGGENARVVNSHGADPNSVGFVPDTGTGRLVSRAFAIERNFISVLVGGGSTRPGSRFGVTLFVEGQPVRAIAGTGQYKMALESIDARPYAGKMAHLEIRDDSTRDMSNLNVGTIVFTDEVSSTSSLEDLSDFGTMALALLGDPAEVAGPETTAPFSDRLIGSLGRKLKLAVGETATVTFVIAWHFRNLSMLAVLTDLDRYYATKYESALVVAQYIAKNIDRLAGQTRLWRDTWYASTLPYWFLDRTFLNTSILATTTSHRMENGRYYGWEGVGCCPGTCTHVYSYAHATARLFPELERDTRERVDFGLAQAADGAIHFRGEWEPDVHYSAVDGQAGTVLRALREHQMSADSGFLNRNWPKIKLATQWLIAKDRNGDGLIEDSQHNTLDTDWHGPVAWLSGMYLAALHAAAEMADEVDDLSFSRQCRTIADAGRQNLVAQLFDGEYFINKPDPKYPESINSGTGCEIDQVLGQSWAWQVGLPRVLPAEETKSALQSLWKYNFSPDVGQYRKHYEAGRWFAMDGEAGLLMCTFPRSDWDYANAKGKGPGGYAGYLNECMNGFEYQVAGHMLWEGMVMEGLALTRAVHGRYHASRRNPWNEVESGDHYARSMASYGVYLAACGFEYDGPQAHIGFAPRLTPENFKCAFAGAEGWGSFAQHVKNGELIAEITVRSGELRLKTVSLANLKRGGASTIRAFVDNKELRASFKNSGDRVRISFADEVTLLPDQALRITLL